MRKHLYFLFVFVCVLVLAPLPFLIESHRSHPCPKHDIVILFDNDVHCATEGYVLMAALRDSMLTTTPYVTTVSCGDFAQGNVMGSLTQGEYIVDIMNAVPYDVTTIGNHEFDYGVPQLLSLSHRLSADVVCCNFSHLEPTASSAQSTATVPGSSAAGSPSATQGQDSPCSLLLAPYSTKTYGRTRVAFVGVATPTTFNTSTPTYFQDSLGNVVYDFHRDDTPTCVQRAVDDARAHGADYVVLLSHLGDDTPLCPAPEVIAATRGIDAVLDGHAHHVFSTTLPNALGEPVLFASTGTKFAHIGRLTISTSGNLSIDLLPTASMSLSTLSASSALPEDMSLAESSTATVPGSSAAGSPTVTQGQDSLCSLFLAPSSRLSPLVDSLQACIAALTSQPVGRAWRELTDHDELGNRLVRHQSTNLSLFLCDAFRTAADAQIGIINGGGIRSFIPRGDISLGQVISVLPFNNRIWRVRATGQQLLDALEVGVRSWPDEDGDYPHLYGARFTIDPSIPSSVTFDEHGLFLSVGDTRRITSLEVKDRWDHWVPIDPNATYTIGGQSYILISGGSSGAYRFFTTDAGPLCTDVDAVVSFIQSSLAERHLVASK